MRNPMYQLKWTGQYLLCAMRAWSAQMDLCFALAKIFQELLRGYVLSSTNPSAPIAMFSMLVF
jgi:hypothetical protein